MCIVHNLKVALFSLSLPVLLRKFVRVCRINSSFSGEYFVLNIIFSDIWFLLSVLFSGRTRGNQKFVRACRINSSFSGEYFVLNIIFSDIWFLLSVLFLAVRGGIRKFVHWRYNGLTTKDIKMIFGELLIWCISSLGGMFQHVAFIYYEFTHLSAWPPWVPRSTPENVRFERCKLFLWIVFSWLRERQNPQNHVKF